MIQLRYHTLNNKMNLLLGDNPFFGIDHLSQDRARKRMETLKGFHKITKVIEVASKFGVNGFVASTHPQLKDLIHYMKNSTDLLEKLEFYPIIPYAQGYVTKVTEKGTVGALRDILSGGTLQEKTKIIFSGTLGILQKYFDKLLRTLIDIELLPLKQVNKKIIFLHDVITDLAISLNMKSVLEIFSKHIEAKYDSEVGLVTKNFPKLVSVLQKWNFDLPTIMTSFNSIGNQMNPSKEACESCLLDNDVKVIAMNVLVGGLLKPQDSAKYISKYNFSGTVIGMSTEEHAIETISAFKN